MHPADGHAFEIINDRVLEATGMIDWNEAYLPVSLDSNRKG